MNIKRNLLKKLLKSLESSPVVLLTGARQVGKTTLMKEVGEHHHFKYITFDDLTMLGAAQQDPVGFISGQPKPLIIDEIQRVPEITLPIKLDVDTHNENGRYALTGSANPLVVPKLNDSLAGRMIILNLWPLSRGELLGRCESFLDTVFGEQWHMPSVYETLNQRSLINLLIMGGYPRMQGLDETMRHEWCNSHLMTILERDAPDIANIKRLKELPLVMKLLAMRASNLLNVSEVSLLAGIPNSTLTTYLHILEALFLIIRQPSWHTNRSKRLTKMPKIYLSDSGLLSYLLGADHNLLEKNGVLLGQVLENFVVQEIRKQATWSMQRVSLYHFRTQAGQEVDLLLENARGHVVGIEIKSSMTVRPGDFKGLYALAEEAGDLFVRGFVVYLGSEVVPFGNNMFALPISALWS